MIIAQSTRAGKHRGGEMGGWEGRQFYTAPHIEGDLRATLLRSLCLSNHWLCVKSSIILNNFSSKIKM